MRNRLISLLLPMIVLLTGGCESLHQEHQANQLNHVLRNYEQAIRWADFNAAEGFRAPQLQSTKPTDLNQYRGFRITSYKTLGGSMNAAKTEFKQRVEIRYYHETRAQVHSMINEQTWRYTPESKQWQLHSPLPVFYQ
jgi:hypothetical protein